nr:DUF2460 domain-containing protein [Sphingorhabdus lutea]
MSYWLCKERSVQDKNVLMRFDPKYWSVNFPRPMMASVVTTAPDAMRVEHIFYHKNEICGLIWNSEDEWDHSLLSYTTNRDYRHVTLKFHWKSHGIVALNAVNGPVLTIEGRDAAGNAMSYYVRLWNYAQGSPYDAQITLNFADLYGGFLLPNEGVKVHAADIDRMFISMAPAGYDGTNTPFAGGQHAWAEISEISCIGEGAILDIGDVSLPEHHVRMASGYDDHYHVTPERLMSQIHALGYRKSINHYVGMSHYFNLNPHNGGHMIDSVNDALNLPCQKWHENFADFAKIYGFELIFSLSYELFDAHCPDDWKQRAANGDPALTGWRPPSTLLSPANDAAMGYLQHVARAFTRILLAANLPVIFQIGEPWWWVTNDHRPCLYDEAAIIKFDNLLTSIADIRGPKTAVQNAMLDKAGDILGQSTLALRDAVRGQAATFGANAKIALLAFLPSILNEESPEMARANLPSNWAYPAFDILQLEDYDWIVEGNFGASDRAIRAANARLNYPPMHQHYFAGFVLRAQDDHQWTHIHQAILSASTRGIGDIFIWALPQILRDGFVYFNLNKEQEGALNNFEQISFPINIGMGATISPQFSTIISTTQNGNEYRNAQWANARNIYDVGSGLRSQQDVESVLQFFKRMKGPAKGFRFFDPLDNSSHNMTGTPSAFDQKIGIGDDVQTSFQLVKNIGEDGHDVRPIFCPIADTVTISLDAAIVQNWTLGDNGMIIFNNPPPNGAVIRAGYLFEVPVRFMNDQIDCSISQFGAGEIPNIDLIELKEAPIFDGANGNG